MLSPPRNPSSTIRIFAAEECCWRVARRMSRITRPAGGLAPAWPALLVGAEDFRLIFTPWRLR